MDDFTQQLLLIRKQQHDKYITHISKEESDIRSKEEETNEIHRVEFMKRMAEKYKYIFNPNPEQRASNIICRFIKKWLNKSCLNDNEIKYIPGIYRFRVDITDAHYKEYSEKNIPDNEINKYRKIYSLMLPKATNIIFRYCFDIRKLYPIRNEIIELFDEFYFLQPYDHLRLVKAWNKVNGETRNSIIYLSDMEYHKSLAVDIGKNKNIEDTKQTIKKNNIDMFDFITDEYLEDLNKKYLNGNKKN